HSSSLLQPGVDSPIGRWLGRDAIWNRKREILEGCYDYLLRHSRLLPRDIVTLGNAICRLVADCKNNATNEIDEAELRAIVHQSAAAFGEEQLRICASHLAALCLPSGAARDGYAEFYVAAEEYRRGMSDKFLEVLREGAGKDRLSADELASLRKCGQ